MNQILSINTIKNVFSALGAKTSNSNYAVPLLDKTSAEPKGIMDMSDLASVLGVNKVKYNWYYTNNTYAAEFRNWALQAPTGAYIGILGAGWVGLVFGYKWSNSDGCFFIAKSNGSGGVQRLGYFDNNDFIVDFSE